MFYRPIKLELSLNVISDPEKRFDTIKQKLSKNGVLDLFSVG